MLLTRLRVLVGCSFAAIAAQAAALKVNGSTTVNLVAAEAAEILRAEKGMQITVDTQGGSSGGISGIGDGSVDVGMSSKPVADDDRRKYPGVDFVETSIGADGVALVVSADVWDGGVKSLTKDQVRSLYESKVKNWKELGGPDRVVTFFNKEPGRGTWEVFAKWAYGDPRQAPDVSLPEVGGNEETRTKVASTPGSITQLSASWAAGNPRVRALGIEMDDGKVLDPTPVNIAAKVYPLWRPLFFITNGAPKGDGKAYIDFVLSARGQELLTKHGYLKLADLKEGK